MQFCYLHDVYLKNSEDRLFGAVYLCVHLCTALVFKSNGFLPADTHQPVIARLIFLCQWSRKNDSIICKRAFTGITGLW